MPERSRWLRWTSSLRRWRYWLEKERPHLTGVAIMVVGLALTITVGGTLLVETGEFADIREAMWWVFLHLSDSGYLGEDRDYITRSLGICVTVLGIMMFLGLISLMTSSVTEHLRELREGGADLAFHQHIVVLGWNNKVFTLVEELLEADRSADVAILADVPKDAAEELLESRLFDPVEQRLRAGRTWPFSWLNSMWHDIRRKVVFRRGNPMGSQDLRRVGVAHARRFILLAPHGEAGMAADVLMLRTYIALQHERERLHKPEFHAVVEITQDRYRSHTFFAAGLDPRDDAWVVRDKALSDSLPDAPADRSRSDLTLVNGDELISRALVQCSVQPRLSLVYNEVLSFHGKDFYMLEFDELPEAERNRWHSILLAASQLDPPAIPGFLSGHLRHGLVVGIYKVTDEHQDAAVDFDVRNWPASIRAAPERPLVVLGAGEHHGVSTVAQRVTLRPAAEVLTATSLPPGKRAGPTGLYRVLLWGFNRRLAVLVKHFNEYAGQYPSLAVQVRFAVEQHRVQEVRALPGVDAADVFAVEYDSWADMGRLLSPGDGEQQAEQQWDSVVLLADEADQRDGTDARVILALVMLRAFRKDEHKYRSCLIGHKTSVVAEILDARHRALFDDEDWVSDVIVSNQYVSRFIAQASHEHRVEDLYRELLDYDKYEMYLREPAPYLVAQQDTPFIEVIHRAAAFGEMAIGYTTASNGAEPSGPRVRLAPEVDELVPADADRVLVIAER